MELLSTSFKNCPLPRIQNAAHTTTSIGPSSEEDHYPTEPMYNRASDFANFDLDTLFFVFYFQPGSPE